MSNFTIKNKKDLGLIIVIFLPIILMYAFLGPLAQSLAYHSFVDQSPNLGIPNFHNVISNIPFLIFAMIGLTQYFQRKSHNLAWLLFLVGVLLVAPGSAYYHYDPNNATLFYDRLPMTIAFMSLVSFALIEQFKIRNTNLFTLGLILFGISTVIYWKTVDDLRLYYWVQLSAITILFYISLAYKKSELKPKFVFIALGFYIIAKFFEAKDGFTYDLFSYSGHSIKHILASFSVYALLKLKK